MTALPENPQQIERLVRMGLSCIHRELPYHLVHVVFTEADVRPPWELFPAFCGCFDWHSAVHSHWSLVRALHRCPHASWGSEVREALDKNLTPAKLGKEAEYFRTRGREGFERPYGLAWLLQLNVELREMQTDADAQRWLAYLQPLEALAVQRLSDWLPKLSHPIRSGEHSQTAFAMGLALDWSHGSGDERFEQLLARRARDFYSADRDAPLRYEPSGHDFLSPALAEADLMRRIMSREEFASWLAAFLPFIPTNDADDWLPVVRSTDPQEGKLSHLDGLNLSRAWMLEGIASALPEDDPRVSSIRKGSRAHAQAGIGGIDPRHYSGAHWLGSFAMYLLTRRGIAGVGGNTQG